MSEFDAHSSTTLQSIICNPLHIPRENQKLEPELSQFISVAAPTLWNSLPASDKFQFQSASIYKPIS